MLDPGTPKSSKVCPNFAGYGPKQLRDQLGGPKRQGPWVLHKEAAGPELGKHAATDDPSVLQSPSSREANSGVGFHYQSYEFLAVLGYGVPSLASHTNVAKGQATWQNQQHLSKVQ